MKDKETKEQKARAVNALVNAIMARIDKENTAEKPTLELHGVKLRVQNLGTILGIFLQGKPENVTAMYNSFYNHGATSGEPEAWSDSCLLFWIHSAGRKTAEEKLLHSMTQAALFETLNHGAPKGSNPWNQCREIAQNRIAQMQNVTWWKAIKTQDQWDMGNSVKAEKATGDISDVFEQSLNGRNLDPVV